MYKLLALMMFCAGIAHAEAADTGSKTNGAVAIKYTPPMRGAPLSRVGGGSRGSGDEMPILQVLAPDHTGLTIQAQPTLYWNASKPAAAHFEVTVMDEKAVEPLAEKSLDVTIKAGVQKLSLSELGITLQPGVEYRWYVSLVSDKKDRSNDILASGTILRKAPSKELLAEISHAKKHELPAIYASNGIWYDAFSSASDLIASDTNNPAYIEQRAELLNQVGLTGL